MTPALLALAWGCLAAVPCIAAARSRTGRDRALRLVGEHETRMRSRSRPAAPAWMRRIPEVWGARRATARAAVAVRAALPVTIDLLAVAVGAGYTPFLAVEVGARWAPPVLAREFERVVGSCRLGADLGHALDGMAAAHAELRGLADALLATERLGAPVHDALQRLAADARAEVRRRAEARARTVPVRLLFPLVFLVLPAFGILTVVPTVAAHLSG